MNDKTPEIPDDLLEEILRFGKKDARRGRQREKDKWTARARALFEPSQRQKCCICDQFIAITHAHHVIPLADQYDRGFKDPDSEHVWLCPNHHAVIHLFLSDGSAATSPQFGGLLQGFSREHIRRLHDLLMRSRRGPSQS